ncbi:2-C-methyl-D-erythritol 2,4-cyclodiphosphate synthase [bacterium]|nr:2-C-methyl-D-erythritol 2,4-cyclodiphosphate synthase [bacterium]
MKLKYRIGNAIDHHYLLKNNDQCLIVKPLVLAGIKINLPYYVDAHSDGDLILHAIANSILNAIGKDDIGTYFKDTDAKIKGINSQLILDYALKEMHDMGYMINNLSIVFESDIVMLAPLKEQLIINLRHLLNTNDISMHGTRAEHRLFSNDHTTSLISCYVTILLIHQGEKNNEE